jgi:hypothetical protein
VALKTAVQQAIREIEKTFTGTKVDVTEDGSGGAHVRVQDLHLGDQYQPSVSWVAFAITFQYPEADVYPHFLVAGFARVDGKSLGESFGQATWEESPVTQVSRRSNNRNQDLDTAAIKLNKVLTWIRSR